MKQREIKIRFNNRGTLQIWTLSQLLLEHKDLTRLKNPQLFTGRKDKRGVEIYKGDFVKDYQGYIWKVEWEFNQWVFKNQATRRAFVPDSVEVIGNITENKDLLK